MRTARSTRAKPPIRTSAFEPPPVTPANRSERPAARITPTRGRADSDERGAAAVSAPVPVAPSDGPYDNMPPTLYPRSLATIPHPDDESDNSARVDGAPADLPPSGSPPNVSA